MKKDKLSISVTSIDVGSMPITLHINNTKIIFYASYIGSNPIVDLINVMDNINNKYCIDTNGNYCENEVSIWWLSEPGILYLTFKNLPPSDNLYIVIDHKPHEDDSPDNQHFEICVSMKAFIDEINRISMQLLKKYGLLGFRDSWADGFRGEFPVAAWLSLNGIGTDGCESSFDLEKQFMVKLYE